jgi:hypothetical protein
VSRSSNVRISLGRTIESPFRCAPSSPPPRVRLPSVSSRPSFLCRRTRARLSTVALLASLTHCPRAPGKGGKNRRRGKNEGDEKRELVFKEDGQGEKRFGRLRTRRCVSRPLLLRLPSLQSMPKCCACSARSPGRPGGGETLALVILRVEPRQRPPRGAVHRRHQAAVPHPRQDAQEGLGEHGERPSPRPPPSRRRLPALLCPSPALLALL